MASLASCIAQIELIGASASSKNGVKAAPVSGCGLRMGRMPGQKEVASLASRVSVSTRAVSGSHGSKAQPVCEVEPGMKIVFVSAEVAPWSKTGGLGDVVGGLPPALAVSGCQMKPEVLVSVIVS